MLHSTKQMLCGRYTSPMKSNSENNIVLKVTSLHKNTTEDACKSQDLAYFSIVVFFMIVVKKHIYIYIYIYIDR